MTTETLSPLPVQRFYDNNNNPAVSAKLFTYQAGTSTKLSTYTDSTGGTANTNPIILNQRGECNLWIPPNVAYKYVFAPSTDTDPPTNPYWTVDQITSSQLITLYGGVSTGSSNNYALTFTANFTSLTDGIIIYWIPNFSSTGPSTINVNGLGVVPFIHFDSSAIAYGEIIANLIVGVIYKGGNWYLLSPQAISGSFTGTLTGMTAATTGSVKYRIINSVATVYSNSFILGTSNSTAMILTGAPQSLWPTANKNVVCNVINNGSNTIVNAFIDSTNGTITFTTLQVSGAFILTGGLFTNSGSKGLDTGFNITYPII